MCIGLSAGTLILVEAGAKPSRKSKPEVELIAACSLYPTTPHSFSLYTTSIASLSFPGVLSFHLFLFLDVCEVFDKRSWDGGVL